MTTISLSAKLPLFYVFHAYANCLGPLFFCLSLRQPPPCTAANQAAKHMQKLTAIIVLREITISPELLRLLKLFDLTCLEIAETSSSADFCVFFDDGARRYFKVPDEEQQKVAPRAFIREPDDSILTFCV